MKNKTITLLILGSVLTVSFAGLVVNGLGTFSHQRNIDTTALPGEYDSLVSSAVFNNSPIPIPLASLDDTSPSVLGDSSGNKRIEVDLTNQRLYAYEGDRLVYNFLVSTGKWGKTPTGIFNIWVKLRYTKMEGGSKAINTYYYLPNVPYVMFFYNDEIPKYRGFGLHGTYWHSNFGYPMSHGCVNMKTEEAGLIYNWAKPDLGNKWSVFADDENPGTQIVIYGVAP